MTSYLHEDVSNSEIFPSKSTEEFHADVRAHLQQQLEGLDPAAVLAVKKLLRAGLNEKNDPNAVNLRESYGRYLGYLWKIVLVLTIISHV